MDNVLVKTTCVLELQAEAAEWVDFAHPSRGQHPLDRTHMAMRRFTLDRVSWEALGKPTYITVTALPGDVISDDEVGQGDHQTPFRLEVE